MEQRHEPLRQISGEDKKQFMKKYEDHEIASCWPLMSEVEIESLGKGIKAVGQLHPIVLYEGKILDGRNRYRSCLLVGVTPRFEDYKGSNPVDYVINQNNNRRHQTLTERGVAAAKLANIKHGGDRKGAEINAPVGALIEKSLISREEAAEKLGVGKGTVDRAKYVLDKGTPETVAALETGKTTVSAAYEKTKSEQPMQTTSISKPPIAPSEGCVWGKKAMSALSRIDENDRLRFQAFKEVRDFITHHYPRLKNQP